MDAGPAVAVKAADHTNSDRIRSRRKNNRNSRGSRRGCHCGRRSSDGNDYRHLAANKISRQFRQSLVFAVRGAVFDGQVLPLDKAGFLQTLPNRRDRHGVWPFKRHAIEQPDLRQLGLLRARHERPSRRATNPRDELSPSHRPSLSAVGSAIYRGRACVSGSSILFCNARGGLCGAGCVPNSEATVADRGGGFLSCCGHYLI
jgi:hypothetical protein